MMTLKPRLSKTLEGCVISTDPVMLATEPRIFYDIAFEGSGRSMLANLIKNLQQSLSDWIERGDDF